MAIGNKSEIVPVRLTPELKADLQKMADIDNRNLSDFIRVQLIKVVETFKKKK
jgi:uncharacterized protein (DUF1778 family)